MYYCNIGEGGAACAQIRVVIVWFILQGDNRENVITFTRLAKLKSCMQGWFGNVTAGAGGVVGNSRATGGCARGGSTSKP